MEEIHLIQIKLNLLVLAKDMIKELLVVDGIESAYTDFDYVNKYNVNIFITYDDTIINEEKLIDLKNKFNG